MPQRPPFAPGALLRMSRRAAVTGAALATLALGACNKGFQPAEGDMTLGAAAGPTVVHVVEYASVTCAHCAAWQDEVWPAFKAKYVDTSKVRFVFREMPTAPVPVSAAGFLTARCAGPDRYFDVVHALFQRQEDLLSGDPRATLLSVAQGAGLTEDRFKACLADAAASEALDKRVKAGVDMGVDGTPAFFINGDKVAQPSLAALSAAIDAALAKNR